MGVCQLRPLLSLAVFTSGTVGILNHQVKCGQTQLAHVLLLQKCPQSAPFASDSGISSHRANLGLSAPGSALRLSLLLESSAWG